MINDNEYYLKLNRLQICDIILALSFLSENRNHWQDLHDNVKCQMENYDTWYIANHKEEFDNV